MFVWQVMALYYILVSLPSLLHPVVLFLLFAKLYFLGMILCVWKVQSKFILNDNNGISRRKKRTFSHEDSRNFCLITFLKLFCEQQKTVWNSTFYGFPESIRKGLKGLECPLNFSIDWSLKTETKGFYVNEIETFSMCGNWYLFISRFYWLLSF